MDGIFLNKRGNATLWGGIMYSDAATKKSLSDAIGLAYTGRSEIYQTGFVKHVDSGGHYTSGATTVLGEVANLDARLYKWTNQTDTVVGDKTISGATETIVGTTKVNITGGDVNITGSTAVKISGATRVDGTTAINGNTSITGSTTITGNETLNGNLTVTGTTNISGATSIDGNVRLGNATGDVHTICGTTNANGNVNITGSTKITSNLTVNGNTTLGDSTGDTLTLNAGTTAANGTKFDALKIVDAGDTSSNVRESWKLVDKAGNQYGNTIKIYKDSSLKSVELTDTSGGTSSGQFLKFTYILDTGEESVVYVDVSSFLVESEFASGVTATTAGIVRGVVDPSSEAFLTVGASGFKISGIQNAINNTVNGLDVDDAPVVNQFVTSVSESNGKISVSRAQPSFTNISGQITSAQHYTVTGKSQASGTSKWVNSISSDNLGHVTGITTSQPSFSDLTGEVSITQLPTGSTTAFGIVKVTNGNGLSISNGIISMAPATSGESGAITTGNQSFAGNKTFTGNVTIQGNTVLGNACSDTVNISGATTFHCNVTATNGNVTLGATTANTLNVTGNATISGDVTANSVSATTGFWQTSDENLKIFAGDVTDNLEKIKSIPTKYFYWKNNPDGIRMIGTSAQKVQEVYPEIVSGDKQLTVDYSKFGLIAIEAVKELLAKVDNLEAEIKALKGE